MARVAKPAARSSSNTRVMPILVQVESCGQDSGGRGQAPKPARSASRDTTPRSTPMPARYTALPEQPYCLIVDDEPRLRQVLVHLMRNDGFTCLEAENGEQAIALLERHPVMLVMSDLRMPKLDGIGLLREIRGRWPDTAVVMITAVADVEVAVSCLAVGAMDYLTKPFHLEEVRARVAQALENRRLVLENRGYQESLREKVAIQARRLEDLFHKPGKLTSEEYEHIMTHPIVGWRILAPLLAETPEALAIVRSHHEWF